MPYNEELALRVGKSINTHHKIELKKMMGGITFMVNNKMCVGVLNDDLMVRIDPDIYEDALAKKGCREMNFTGKPMKGFVFVGPEGTKTQKDLEYWIGLALRYNDKAKPSRKTGRRK